MTRQITITLSDHIYDLYVMHSEGKNRSQHVEKLIQYGGMTLDGDIDSQRKKWLEVQAENRQLKDIIKSQKAQLAKLRKNEELEELRLKRERLKLEAEEERKKAREERQKEKERQKYFKRLQAERAALRASGIMEDPL